MDWIVLEGVKPWDGRYEFDLAGQELTNREWGFIKRLSGYLPLTLQEGFEGGDPELFAVFAVIALRRAGRVDAREVPVVFERLGDTPFGTTIRLESDTVDEEGDAGPPVSSSNGSSSISGPGSTTSSEGSDATRTATGTDASGSAASDLPTWVT